MGARHAGPRCFQATTSSPAAGAPASERCSGITSSRMEVDIGSTVRSVRGRATTQSRIACVTRYCAGRSATSVGLALYSYPIPRTASASSLTMMSRVAVSN